MTHTARPNDRQEGAAFPACPSCGAPQGEPCTGSWTCRSRIEAAGKTTCRFHGIVPEGHDCRAIASAAAADEAAPGCACGHPANAHDIGIGICEDCYCDAYRKAA
jgi:hypothetical protein